VLKTIGRYELYVEPSGGCSKVASDLLTHPDQRNALGLFSHR
jgi:hypothetical protein